MWLQSRDLATLQQEAEKQSGKLSIVLNGQKCTVESGKHFYLPERNTVHKT